MTNNNSNSSKSPDFSEPSPFKLVMLSAITLLICIVCCAAVIYSYTHTQAKLYTAKQVTMVKNQAKLTLQPMILSKDILSMNVYLQSLSEADFINGITLANNKQQLIARAGLANGQKEELDLFSQRLAIAKLTFYINNNPANLFFKQLLWLYLALALISSVITLIALAYFSKKILKDFSQRYQPLLQHSFSLELAKANTLEQESAAHFSTVSNKPNSQTNTVIKDTNSFAIVDLKNSPTASIDPAIKKEVAQLLENNELVSLLKPDTQERMPRFKPFNEEHDETEQPAIADNEIELTETIQFVEERPKPAVTPNNINNPLLRKPQEEQLDLYSLEHQTELSLKAADAAYMLFIDCSSGRDPIEEQEEHTALLTQYRKLIKLVINIYGGHLELLANGDIRVLFDDRDKDDNHGIQALCAAKLFNQLYKYYNHRQITRMQPTLNIQTSLVRGNREKIELLREESHFLTCTTASNELISHTPLSEVAALKESLLAGAHTERQDEDKILIISLSPSYQELLEKQARHLAKSI
jgi:cell division protein FtsL